METKTKKEMIIITGCPRSGTGFMGQLFTYAGIPCGHEQLYGFNYRVENPKAESSWMAAPHLKKHKKIIHITRDPLKVISSLVQAKGLEDKDNNYITYVYKYLPSLRNYEGLDKYLYFYIKWNEKIEKYTKNRYRIEDINKDKRGFISKFIKPKRIYTKEDYNTYKQPSSYFNIDLTLDDIPKSEMKTKFIKMAKRYGYDYKT